MLRCGLVVACLFSTLAVSAQEPAAAPLPSIEALPNGVARVAGFDSVDHGTYVRLFLNGHRVNGHTPTTTVKPAAEDVDFTQPVLTGECTKLPNGKASFELFVNYGNVLDMSFHPAWHPGSSSDLFPPVTVKQMMTMEFLGYTHVKPVKRQFEHVTGLQDQLHYNSPGGGSTNMEPAVYWLQYLRSLPTLRITGPAGTVDFFTTPLLERLAHEPACAGLAI